MGGAERWLHLDRRHQERRRQGVRNAEADGGARPGDGAHRLHRRPSRRGWERLSGARDGHHHRAGRGLAGDRAVRGGPAGGDPRARGGRALTAVPDRHPDREAIAVPDSRAGTPAEPADLIDVPDVVAAYYALHPDPSVPAQRVAFGTSGHRGSSLDATFNEDHIAATCQAVVEYRRQQGVDGPLFLGRDTHALSTPAQITAIEVFAANGVPGLVDSRDGYTPTPALSRAIVRHNASGPAGRADGVLITPSHNPPRDGGIKYNAPHGGPAGSDITGWIQRRANELLAAGLAGVERIGYAKALAGDLVGRHDYLDQYVGDLSLIIDLDAIRGAGLRIGVDPLGGASVAYWPEIAERYKLGLEVLNGAVDPTWRFMTLDWDGKIRMDPSSANAMASLVANRGEYDLANGNDADADRHGIVTADRLMNPNPYLAVAIDYLYRHRPEWPARAPVGKTMVSSSIIDRVVTDLGRELVEVPAGFKWFVPGLSDGSIAFGGEESAGASFLCT